MERETKSIEKEMEEEKNLTDSPFKFSIPEVCPCSLKDLTSIYAGRQCQTGIASNQAILTPIVFFVEKECRDRWKKTRLIVNFVCHQ